MLLSTLVQTTEELQQIHRLNLQNLKQKLVEKERSEEGFVTWLYPLGLLEKMHELAPSIVIKDGEQIVAYALTTVESARSFHPDLDQMFRNLEQVQYQGRPLHTYRYYCMGQICVAKDYRGKGLVSLLYQKHKEVYGSQYDFILTEISTSNLRSQRAHEKIGFQTIYQYRDDMDEWNVVVWEWRGF